MITQYSVNFCNTAKRSDTHWINNPVFDTASHAESYAKEQLPAMHESVIEAHIRAVPGDALVMVIKRSDLPLPVWGNLWS